MCSNYTPCSARITWGCQVFTHQYHCIISLTASPDHKINHLFSESRRRPDREPAAIKSSGTGPHSHQTFYWCTRCPQHQRRRWVSGQKCSALCLSTSAEDVWRCAPTTLCLYLKKRMGQKSSGTRCRPRLNKHNA